MRSVKMRVGTDSEAVKMKVQTGSHVRSRVGTAIEIEKVEGPPYTGSYEVTPSTEEQTLQTDGFLMHGNVTINPIPDNYGLITWDGSTLMVS